MLDCLCPEDMSPRDRDLYREMVDSPSEERLADNVRRVWGAVRGYRIVSRRLVAPDHLDLEVLVAGPGWGDRPHRITLKKRRNEWKITDLRHYDPRGGVHGDVRALALRQSGVNPLVGIWRNEDLDTGSITRIEISVEENSLVVRAWGRCHPFDCYWGRSKATLVPDAPNVISVAWVKSFCNRLQRIELKDEDRLECVTETRYTDGSGRQDGNSVDYFARGQ